MSTQNLPASHPTVVEMFHSNHKCHPYGSTVGKDRGSPKVISVILLLGTMNV